MISAVAKTLPQTVTVWVYGSEARGDARADSDIDLLMLVDKPSVSFYEQMELSKPFYDIELETGIQINPHIETKESWESRFSLFTYNVNRERVAV